MTTISQNVEALKAIIDLNSVIQKINIDKSIIEQTANRLFSYKGDITPEVKELCIGLKKAIDNSYVDVTLRSALDALKGYIPEIN